MTDIIGVLGESTTSNITAGSSYTAYTVPAGKSAKVRMQYRGQAATGAATAGIELTVNGVVVGKKTGIAADNYVWSTKALLVNVSASEPTATSDATTVAPAPYDYYLSAGDTVRFKPLAADWQAMNFQVVGTEVDAS